MRTRRATNCAIAPSAGTGYQPGRPDRKLLARRSGQVVLAVGRVLEVLEDGILVVDLEHHGPWPTQPRRDHVELAVERVLHAQPRPGHPLGTPAPQLLLD